MAFQVTVTTVPGFEDIAVMEAAEITGAKAAAANGVITFQLKEWAGLCRLCYLSQSAISVSVGSAKVDFEFARREYGAFGKSTLMAGPLAYLFLRASGYTGKEFLFDPFTGSGAIAIEAAIFSSGFPLNYYRKDALTSALSKFPELKSADFERIFSKAGEEWAAAAKKRLKTSKPVIKSSSDSMQVISFAEKSAKIAGVNKLIRFSRLDIEWLDAKLEERNIGLVVTFPPQFSGSGSFSASTNSKLPKLYSDFFYQADFFLKSGGEVVFLLNKPSLVAIGAAAAKYKFKLKVLRKVALGNESLEIVSFAK